MDFQRHCSSAIGAPFLYPYCGCSLFPGLTSVCSQSKGARKTVTKIENLNNEKIKIKGIAEEGHKKGHVTNQVIHQKVDFTNNNMCTSFNDKT